MLESLGPKVGTSDSLGLRSLPMAFASRGLLAWSEWYAWQDSNLRPVAPEPTGRPRG